MQKYLAFPGEGALPLTPNIGSAPGLRLQSVRVAGLYWFFPAYLEVYVRNCGRNWVPQMQKYSAFGGPFLPQTPVISPTDSFWICRWLHCCLLTKTTGHTSAGSWQLQTYHTGDILTLVVTWVANALTSCKVVAVLSSGYSASDVAAIPTGKLIVSQLYRQNWTRCWRNRLREQLGLEMGGDWYSILVHCNALRFEFLIVLRMGREMIMSSA